MGLLKARGSRIPTSPSLRNTDATDADRIRRVLQVAFEDEYRRMGMREIRLPTVSDELLGFMIDRCPEASFVAEGKGGIMAFSLACRWGTTAWLGPIAVLPPAQGQGIGRQLVNASRAVLDDLGVATVGIETMPRSYRNLQFYSRLGMAFECMTLDMSLTKTGLEAWSAETEGTELSIEALEPAPEQDRTRILDQVAVLSGRVAPGLDYRPEAVQTLNHRLGDAFVARIADVPVGFAVAHTVPYAREEMPGTARINTLVVAPPPESPPLDAISLLDVLLGTLAGRLLAGGCDALTVRVPVRQSGAHQLLIRRGFRITHSDVRMTFEGFPSEDRPGTVHLSKWE